MCGNLPRIYSPHYWGAGWASPPLRLAAVVPWREDGQWALAHLPPGFAGEVVPVAGDTRLPPYLRERAALRAAAVDWSRFDVAFAWELRAALAVAGELRRLPPGRRPHWVALGPILKGPVLRALPLLRRHLAGADRIACFSRAECEQQARLLRLPRERFVFVPSPWHEQAAGAAPDGEYVLALGRSNRDWGTLMAAVAGTDLPVVVAAGARAALRGAGPVPPNVTVWGRNAAPEEADALVAGARLCVVPLRASGFSAGQSVLLRSMAAGKAVVAADTPGLRDYVQKDTTAALVPPGDVPALRAELLRLWEDREARESLGGQATRAVRNEFSFGPFAARLAALAGELTSL